MPVKYGTGARLAIGSAAGEEEGRTGVPFTGGAGRWLRGSLNATTGKRYGGFYGEASVREETVSYVNVLSCRPPESIFPTDPSAKKYITKEQALQAVAHCKAAHLDPVLKSRPWTRVDLFGDEAIHFLAGKSHSIDKWRGSPMIIPEIDPKNPVAVATLHPSEVAKNQTMLPVVINDLRKSMVQPPEFYSAYPSLAEVKQFTFKDFAFDIETDGWSRKIKIVGLCAKPFFAMAVPFSGAYIPELQRIFAEAKSVVGQNLIQFDLPILAENNVPLNPAAQIWDIMLLHHLRFPDFPHDLEFIGSQFSNKPAWKHEKGSLEIYCCRDTDVTYQCFKQLLPLVRQESLESVYQDISLPMGKIAQLMTRKGVKQNPQALVWVRERLLAESAQEETKLPPDLQRRFVKKTKRMLAPPGTLSPKTKKPVKYIKQETDVEEIPWHSADVKKKFLYEELGLPPQYHLKTKKLSVDKIALDKLIRRCGKEHPWLVSLKKLAKNATLLNGFLKESPTGEAKVIHPSFNVHGTSTGRLSSSGPNFQNQPEVARHLYVPHEPGNKLVECPVEGSRILLASGAWKLVEDLKVGDDLAGFSEAGFEGTFGSNPILAISSHRSPTVRGKTSQGDFHVSPGHLFLTKGGLTNAWVKAKNLKPGDTVVSLHDYHPGLMANTAPARVQWVTEDEIKTVYAIKTKYGTFVMDGLLSHNCDYSGIENRLVAYFANDTERLGRFQTIKDFNEHKWVTSVFFDIPMDEVEKDNDPTAPYGKSKRINHGSGYLMGAAKIASMYDMDVHEVKKLQAILKAAMPATTDWQRSTVKQVEKDGVLVNPFGRKRWFWTDRAATEGVAFLPQSTGADIIFRAMIGLLYERIGMAPETAQRISPVCRALPTGVSLLLTVHDSLLFECPPEKLSELLSCLHAVLEQPWPQLGGFILPISIGVGETWGSVESYKETV